MFQKFYPDEWVDSTYVIPFEQYYEKGYRGILFDIDNTLVRHGEPATKEAEELFERLHKIGFSTCLISRPAAKVSINKILAAAAKTTSNIIPYV